MAVLGGSAGCLLSLARRDDGNSVYIKFSDTLCFQNVQLRRLQGATGSSGASLSVLLPPETALLNVPSLGLAV